MWSHSYVLGRRAVYDDARHRGAGRQALLESLVRHPRVIAGALIEHAQGDWAGELSRWHLAGDRVARQWLLELEALAAPTSPDPSGWWTLVRLEHKLGHTSWEVWLGRIQARPGVFERLWLVTPRGTRHDVMRRLLDGGLTSPSRSSPHT